MSKRVTEKQIRNGLKLFKQQATIYVKQMSAARDALRKLVGEYEEILDYCDEAKQAIDAGIERISEII